MKIVLAVLIVGAFVMAAIHKLSQILDTEIADSFKEESIHTLCGHCGRVVELVQGDVLIQLLDYTIFSELPWDITTLKRGSYGIVCQRCVATLDKGKERFDEPDYAHPRELSTEELKHLARDV